MIALRKDVKLGFTIGGIVLGVFGVYLGLSALAGQRPDTSLTGANLQLTPFGSTPGTTAVVDANTTKSPAVVNPQPKPITTPSAPAVANSVQQIASSESGPDIWSNAFQTGKLQQPAVTVTPDASSQQVAGNSPKPSDVISAINNPPTDSNKASPKEQPANSTASAADGSGALVDLTSSTLTRSGSTTQPSGHGTAKSHTIEAGETFSSIAANYYGDAKYYRVLVDANPQIDPNRLKPGVIIKVPELAKQQPKSDTTDVPSVSKIDPTKQYVVQSGDSLSKIATTLYGDQNMWQKIYDFNKSVIGDSPAKLKVGMTLNLPSPPTKKQ